MPAVPNYQEDTRVYIFKKVIYIIFLYFLMVINFFPFSDECSELMIVLFVEMTASLEF